MRIMKLSRRAAVASDDGECRGGDGSSAGAGLPAGKPTIPKPPTPKPQNPMSTDIKVIKNDIIS